MSLAILWLALVSLLAAVVPMASHTTQSDCVGSFVGSGEILASKAMDVDRDGQLDTVIIYGQDDLFIAIISNPSAADCKVVLNSKLTWRDLIDQRQKVTIRAIELVDVTGDDQPELHIALEKRGGGPREEVTLNALYMMQNGAWREILRFTSCLAFNTFEFRNDPDGGKSIYTDEDRHCEPPWSSRRTYDLMRWDGSKFVTVESGFKPKEEFLWPEGGFQACLILLTLVLLVMALVVAGLFAMRAKIRRTF